MWMLQEWQRTGDMLVRLGFKRDDHYCTVCFMALRKERESDNGNRDRINDHAGSG